MIPALITIGEKIVEDIPEDATQNDVDESILLGDEILASLGRPASEERWKFNRQFDDQVLFGLGLD